MSVPIIKVDLHGMRQDEARKRIEQELSRIDSGTYQIQLIHGFHRGTNLRSMILEEYQYDSRVKRVIPGDNMGITVLVIREF